MICVQQEGDTVILHCLSAGYSSLVLLLVVV